MSDQAATWEGRAPSWYLWDGGFMALGRSEGVVPPHAHHAIQIVLALEERIALREPDQPWQEMRGGIVRADVPHSFDGRGAMICMLFVDPESHEGRWLSTPLQRAVTPVPDARLELCLPPLRTWIEAPLEALGPAELVQHTVRSLTTGAPPSRRIDPRVAEALRLLRGADPGRPSLARVASTVFLSPSRFAHLFSAHVGLPFRRYVLWRKLSRAMVAIGHGSTLTAAAHEAGFSDSAHLTRTFHQMFGTPPSVMMKGEFFVVPSPFGEGPGAR